MFTAIYNTVQNALSSDSPLPDREDTDSRSDSDLPSYPSSQCSYTDSSSEFEADVEVKNIDGKVTKLLSGYGLINGDVYFSFDTVAGEYRPSVGDSVYAIIYRDKKTSGWRAKRVTLEERDWGYADFPEDMVGIITKATRIETVINDVLQCTHDSIVQGYRPHPGDWIQASTHKDLETGNTLVKDVRPLREQKIYGTISHIYVGYGFIDYRTYFAFSACQCGYVPEKGDNVIALCIEAKQKRGNWRAVSVELKREKQLPRPEDLITGPLQSIKTDLIKDKCGIIITDKLDFALIANGKTKQIYFWIRNVGIGLQVLKGFTICNLHSEVTIDFPEIRNNGKDKTEGEKKEDKKEGKKEEIKEEQTPSKQIWILPGRAIQGTITIKPQNLGRFRELVTFDFGSFQIGRYIYMEVEDENMKLIRSHGGNRSKGNSLQKFKDRYFNSQTTSAIYGVQPTRNFNWNTPVKLKRHPVPAELVQCVLEKREVESLIPQLQQSLCIKNYFTRFSALLHLEEIQMEIDIRKYDLERESLRKHGEYLSLDVNGLAEGRPSVLVGDKIILTPLDALPHTITYEGFVHQVHGEEVLLKFHPSFHEEYTAEEYHVTFTFSKTVLQRCHQAADMAENIGNRILFPSWKNIEVKPPQVSITFPESRQPVKATFRQPVVATRVASPAARPRRRGVTSNQSYLPRHSSSAGCQFVIPKFSTSSPPRSKQKGEKIVGEYFDKKLNSRQKIAVFRILQGQARPTPYILFGPPGTGKTVTVVESILQVHKHVRSSRILACTPSNSAADLLTSRLAGSGRVKQNDLVRLNSFRRLEDNIDDDIRSYCTDGQQLEVVAHHRIIVCTCSSAGMFFQLKLRPGHFTHIYVDEAGQAMEPECLIPVALATGDDSQIILAGDPMQLGPVLQSRQSLKLGLNQSLLERLMKRPVYLRDEKKFRDHGSYDPLLVTKLVDNYRSHECVLHIPSHLFYHNELVVKADESIRNRFKSWDQLPSKHNFPIIFHGIQGEELQEGNSPSWFNAAEAVQTLKYVQALLHHSEQMVEAQDCGIITPYRKQVEKIRLLLTSVGIDDIKVGSVEEFQGQEKPVIIISTVRSGEDYIGFDLRHKLGFLSNPKRFNVSVTRAQALLVIVGNPHVLAKDPKWLAMLTYCIKNDAYVGCQLPDLERRDEMELIKLEQSFYDIPQPEESVEKREEMEKSDGKLVLQPEESVVKLEKVEKSDGILVPQPEESVAKLEKVEKSDGILVPQPEESVAKLEKVEKSDGILVPQPEKSVAKLEKVEKSDGILEVGQLNAEMSQTNGDLTQSESKMSENEEDDIKNSHKSLSNFLKDLGIIENSSESTTVTETSIDIDTGKTLQNNTTKNNIKDSDSEKHHHLNSEPSSSNTSNELDNEKEKQSDVLFVGPINVSDQKVARDVVASEGQINGQHKEMVTVDENSQMSPKSASKVQGFKLEDVDVQGWKKVKEESDSLACCRTDGFDAVGKQVGRPVTKIYGDNEEAYDSKSVKLNHQKVHDAPITTEHVEAEQQIKEYMTTTLHAQTRDLMSFANNADIIAPAADNHVETRDLITFENVSTEAVPVTNLKSIIGDMDGSSVDHHQVSVDPLLVSVDPLLVPLIQIPQLDDRSSDVRICSDTSIQNWITDDKSDESSSKINLCSTDDSGSIYLGNNKEPSESCVKEDLKLLTYFTSTPLFPKCTENLLGFDSENNVNGSAVDVICDLDQSCNACSYDSSLQLSDIQYTDSSSSQQQIEEISTAVGDLQLSVETSCSTSETNTSNSIECSLFPPSSFVCGAVWPNSDMRRLSDKNDHLYIDEQNNQLSTNTPLFGGREVEEACSRKQFIELIKEETTVPIENDDMPDWECLVTERENVPKDFCLHDDDGPPPLIDLELEDDDGPPPLLWVNDIS
ncbi:RNA helicase Mov10l1-like [Antedon mediterranea]|uniref:RNA helicase Mov10l1-like n=1 Tax=Antedon mediterranea TaxID=105859 RepID=UPI003AF8E6B2